jgi:hypothetical protein
VADATTTAAAASGFTPVTPCRAFDTRTGSGTCTGSPRRAPAAVGTGTAGVLKLRLTGVAGIPTSATSVVLNVTAVGATRGGFLAVFPDGQALPTVSNLNMADRRAYAGLVTVRLGTGGTVDVYNALGTVQVVLDVAGFYSPTSTSGFTSLEPCRLLDTRVGTGTCAASPSVPAAPVTGGSVLRLTVTGAAEVPADATAVVLNLTATGLRGAPATAVTAYPAGTPRPLVSNLNVASAGAVANLVTVRLGTGGAIDLVSSSGTVDLVADLTGYYESGSGALFSAVNPCRVFDTRTGAGQCGGAPTGAAAAVAGPGGIAVTLPGVGGVPVGATAALLNVTATRATGSTFVAAVPDDTDQAPTVSSLNSGAGATVPNLAVARLPGGTPSSGAAAGVTDLFVARASVHLVVDLEGYFAPGAATVAASRTFPVTAMRVNLLDQPRDVAVGYVGTFAGLVVDGVSGTPTVALQRLVSGSWVTQSSSTPDGGGRYTATVTPATAGTTQWRSRATWSTGQVLISAPVELVAAPPYTTTTLTGLPRTVGALSAVTLQGAATNNTGLSGSLAVQFQQPGGPWLTFVTVALPADGATFAVPWSPGRLGPYTWHAVASWSDGTQTVSGSTATQVDMAMGFTVSGPLTAAHVPYSYRAGCPVVPSSLRALSMNIITFSGVVTRGTLVLDAGSVGAMEAMFNVAEMRAGFRVRSMVPTDAFYVGGFATSPTGSDINSMNAGNTSEFNCRSVTGNPYRISQHSYGNAIDINTYQNPYVVGSTVYPASAAAYVYNRAAHYADMGIIAPGSAVANAMADLGWQWGARWASPDFQHFSSNGG